jgi:hypothetical protein
MRRRRRRQYRSTLGCVHVPYASAACTSVAALLSCAWQTQCEDVEDAGGGKEGETLSLEGWDPPAEAAAFLRAVAPAMLAQLEANAASHAFDGGGVARVRNVCVCA